MDKFPAEFSDLLKRNAVIEPSSRPLGTAGDFVRCFTGVIDASTSKQALQLLHNAMTPHLQAQNFPIDPALIKKLKHNFSESLPKTFRNATVTLNSPRAKAVSAAREIGLLQMLGSKSLHQFAQDVSGYKLETRPGFQVSRYKPGDFVGPHNDHHPEEKHLRNGYIDFQITLTSPAVANQYLIYEQNGFLNSAVDYAIPSAITVAHLPFWHQVTPLIAKKGKEAEAERWLLMVSFNKA